MTGTKNYRKLFKEYDTNNSGYLSADEFGRMFKKLLIYDFDWKCLLPIFYRFDRDNSGFIEFSEFDKNLCPH